MAEEDDARFNELLRASSLGTTGARRLRKRTDPDTLAIAQAAAQALNGQHSGAGPIATLHPRTYTEARTVGEVFRQGRPVIMGLDKMDDRDATRLVDFAAGLTFALHGRIERVSGKVFLLMHQLNDRSTDRAEKPVGVGGAIATLHPRTYTEARTVGEMLRQGRPVIMGLEKMDDRDATRLVDFAAGLTFALHGRIERVSGKVFLLNIAGSAWSDSEITGIRKFHAGGRGAADKNGRVGPDDR